MQTDGGLRLTERTLQLLPTMAIIFASRPFHPDELRFLQSLKSRTEQEGGNFEFAHFLLAALSGAGCAYVAAILPDGIWLFVFGTLAVLLFGIAVFVPYEVYKRNKGRDRFLRTLATALDRGTLNTSCMIATRIAFAEEYEDEGDLYIIESDTNEVLYLWDYDYNLQEKFPCLAFELYDDEAHQLLGRQLDPISERISPIVIKKEAKWNLLLKNGHGTHLSTTKKNFDEIVAEINSCME